MLKSCIRLKLFKTNSYSEESYIDYYITDFMLVIMEKSREWGVKPNNIFRFYM